MLNIQLDRPLAFFDIEATGISPRADRIVELAIVKLMPDGSETHHTYRFNPEMPIPSEVAAIHGITDADVAECPTFVSMARTVHDNFENCDLAGYNIIRYDIPMLEEEMLRAQIRFQVEGRRILDAQRIFHKMEPRDLTAALAFYCNETHSDAHGAEADVRATMRVLAGQLERYRELPRDIDRLDDFCTLKKPGWVDRQGRLRWVNGEVTINFGRKKGTPLRELIETDAGFIKWMLRSDFPMDTLDIVRNAQQGIYPEREKDDSES